MPDISTFNKDDVHGESSLFYNQLLPFELKIGSFDPFSDPPTGSNDRRKHSFCKKGHDERLARKLRQSSPRCLRVGSGRMHSPSL